MGTVPRTVRRWVRRLVVACALFVVGCGSGESPGWSQVQREPSVEAAETVPAPVLAAIVVHGATVAAAVTAATPEPAAKTPRRRRVPRRAQTLAGALRRAWIAGRITERDYRAGRRVDAQARAALGRLGGVRRAELARVVAELNGLAAQGVLISSRLPLAVLTLRRNVEVFTRLPVPGPGERLTFGKDPIVFQHWSGKGIAFHPLATAGKVNALAQPCLARTESGTRAVISAHDRRRTCRPRALRRAAGRLMRLASDRAGYKAWESLWTTAAARRPGSAVWRRGPSRRRSPAGASASGEPRLQPSGG